MADTKPPPSSPPAYIDPTSAAAAPAPDAPAPSYTAPAPTTILASGGAATGDLKTPYLAALSKFHVQKDLSYPFRRTHLLPSTTTASDAPSYTIKFHGMASGLLSSGQPTVTVYAGALDATGSNASVIATGRLSSGLLARGVGELKIFPSGSGVVAGVHVIKLHKPKDKPKNASPSSSSSSSSTNFCFQGRKMEWDVIVTQKPGLSVDGQPQPAEQKKPDAGKWGEIVHTQYVKKFVHVDLVLRDVDTGKNVALYKDCTPMNPLGTADIIYKDDCRAVVEFLEDGEGQDGWRAAVLAGMFLLTERQRLRKAPNQGPTYMSMGAGMGGGCGGGGG